MKRFVRHLAQFRKLTLSQQRTLLAAALWMPVFWLGLRMLGLPRFQVWLRGSREPRWVVMTLDEIQALAELVNIAARHTLGPVTCLTRSLLLGWMLRRRGVESQLRIGVRLASGVLEAHAWLECEGAPVNDRRDVSDEFAPFSDLVRLEAFHAP